MSVPKRAVVSKETKWGRLAGMRRVDDHVFANPYFARETTPELRRDLYRDWITRNDSVRAGTARATLPQLRGKTLACTCPIDQPCHADVLLELANA